MAWGDEQWDSPSSKEEKRKMEEEKERQERNRNDRVFVILRQMEDLKFADFKRLSTQLDIEPDDLFSLVQDTLEFMKTGTTK